MKRFESQYIESLSNEDKQYLLISSIPLLSGFESKSGNEGSVFFVSNDVIVKRYFSKIDRPDVLENIFNKYCDECNEFNKKGYNIPKIYTWTMISRPDHSGFDYYLLEQRVPGRELFISNIMKMYEEFSDKFSEDEFKEIVENPEKNSVVYERVIKSYIHDFIEMNERIESMSNVEIEKFLEGVYSMFIECNYAIPDVHARNVLFHQGKLNLIDLYLEKDEIGREAIKMTPAENLLLARMIALFKYNANIKQYKTKEHELMGLNKDIDINEVLCLEAMKKIIRASKRICKFSKNKEWWERLVVRIEEILDKEKTEEIIKEIGIDL